MLEFSKKRYIRLVLVAVLSCLLVCLLCFCSSEEVTQSRIVEAKIKNNRKTVSVEVVLSDEDVTLYKDEKIYLLSLSSSSVTGDHAVVVGESKAKSKMTFNIKLSEQKASFISSALVLAKKSGAENALYPSYEMITELEYISNPSILATENYGPVKSDEIKGLESHDMLDCSAIGAQKTLIEVDINTLMSGGYTEGSINYIYDGVSYYFDGEKVAELDKEIKTATMLGLRVYLRTVILPPDEDSAEINDLYAGTPTKNTKGCVINTSNPVAMGFLRAFYSFLAERYNDPDALAIDVIIGEKVNDYKTNCLATDVEDFESSYFAWARVANNIFKSYNRNSQIYISVDGNMRVDGTDAIGTKVFLSKFAQDARLSGDYDYAIALSLGNGEDLGDILSGKNSELSQINANSFESFTDLTSSEEMLCQGKERVTIIDDLSLPNEISEQNRAAYYAYTYYKARESGFEALFYNSSAEGCDILNGNGERRDFFYSLFMCGSNFYTQIYEYLGKIQNADIPKLAEYISTNAVCEQEIPCEISDAAKRNKKAFPAGVCDMEAVGSAIDACAELKKSADGTQKTHLTLNAPLAEGTAALVLREISGADIIESGYIGVDMYTPLASDVELIVSCEGKDGRVLYIGEAKVGSVEKSYYFNVSEFTDGIKESDKLTLSLRIPRYAENRDQSLTVSDISLYGSSGNGSSTVVAVIVVVVSTLAVCGLLFLLTQRRKRRIQDDEE